MSGENAGPAWLGLGAQRSGTTWFAGLLTQHPEVDLGTNGRKEQHQLHRIAAGRADESAYLELFPDDMLRGEWTPIYLATLSTPAVAARLARPGAPFLVLLRDPLDRFTSAMRVRRGGERRHRWPYPAALSFHQWLGMYADHLEVWSRVVGRERLIVKVYEDVVLDPQSSCESVWSALGVDSVAVREVEAASSSSTKGADWTWPDGLRTALELLYRPQVERLRDVWGLPVQLWRSFS
jgi:hypothetical protein